MPRPSLRPRYPLVSSIILSTTAEYSPEGPLIIAPDPTQLKSTGQLSRVKSDRAL